MGIILNQESSVKKLGKTKEEKKFLLINKARLLYLVTGWEGHYDKSTG